MSEYIVDIPESYPFKIVQDGWHYHIECEYQQREKIVRCCDCIRYSLDDYGNTWCAYVASAVQPDDFCAWGERRW